MRRTSILSITMTWVVAGMMTLAYGQGKPTSPAANLQAVVASTGPLMPNDVVLRIAGDYAFHTTRATGDTVLVDLRGVKVAGAPKDGKLGSGVATDYHLVQYMDASGVPVVRVQLNLREPETMHAYREAAGLRLAFGSGGRPSAPEQSVTSTPAVPSLPKATVEKEAVAGPLKATGVKISVGPAGETIVDITTSGQAPYTLIKLQNPPRLVVDLEGVINAAQKAYEADSPHLKGVRVGQFRAKDPSVVRVVADLKGEPVFDVHAQAGGIRVMLKGKSGSPTPIAAAPPIAPAAPIVETASSKPVERITVPHPEEILTAKEEPAAPVAESSAKPIQEVAASSPKPVEKPEPSTIDFKNTLPAAISSTEVAATPKQETRPATSEEALQAARAALTMANHPGLVAAAPQEHIAMSSDVLPQYTGEPISLNLKDVDLKDFFRLTHEISGLNLIVDPNVAGNVTLVLDAVPWDQALDIVLKNNRLGKTLEGNVLRIARIETLTAEEEAATKLAAAREESLPLVTIFRPVNYAKASAINTMLKGWVGGGALSKRGNVLVDDRTNTLIISDIQSQIPVILSIIEKLDKKAKQVQIEARIIRASATFSRALGVALNLGLVNNSGRTIAGGATGPSASSGTGIPTGSTPPPETVTLTPAKAAGFGSFAITNAGANYFINAAIAAEETKGTVKTISKPTIVTQNNVPGTVTQGSQIPIQTTINNTISIQYVSAALTLKVTPQVTDDGNIFLDITVTNSSPGIVLTTAGPSIDTQQATTQVLVPDGGTVIFGGVNVTRREKNHTQVPVLGSIPILGNLFKSSTTTDSDAELLFFVSPKVLPG